MKADMNNDFNIYPTTNSEHMTTSGSYNTGHTANFKMTGWDFFQNYYYPYVIKESYPVYLQERAVDKSKQAFEVLKTLKDKKLLKIDKVDDFIEAMDALIKVL